MCLMDFVYKDVLKVMFLLMIVLEKYWFICINIFISINIYGLWFYNILKDIYFVLNGNDCRFICIFFRKYVIFFY